MVMQATTQESGTTLMRDQLSQLRIDSQRAFDRLDKRFDDQDKRFVDWFEAQRQQRESDLQYRQSQYERYQLEFNRLTQADNDRKREIDQQKNQMDRFEQDRRQTFKEFQQTVLNKFVEKDQQHEAEILVLRKSMGEMQDQMRRLVWQVGIIVGTLSSVGMLGANVLMQ